jgi:hypothetical protein
VGRHRRAPQHTYNKEAAESTNAGRAQAKTDEVELVIHGQTVRSARRTAKATTRATCRAELRLRPAGKSQPVRFGRNVEVRPLGGGPGCLVMLLVSVLLSVGLTVLVNLGR